MKNEIGLVWKQIILTSYIENRIEHVLEKSLFCRYPIVIRNIYSAWESEYRLHKMYSFSHDLKTWDERLRRPKTKFRVCIPVNFWLNAIFLINMKTYHWWTIRKMSFIKSLNAGPNGIDSMFFRKTENNENTNEILNKRLELQ